MDNSIFVVIGIVLVLGAVWFFLGKKKTDHSPVLPTPNPNPPTPPSSGTCYNWHCNQNYQSEVIPGGACGGGNINGVYNMGDTICLADGYAPSGDWTKIIAC